MLMQNQQIFDIVIEPKTIFNENGVAVDQAYYAETQFTLPNMFHPQHFTHVSVAQCDMPNSIYNNPTDLILKLSKYNNISAGGVESNIMYFTIHRGQINFQNLVDLIQQEIADQQPNQFIIEERHQPNQTTLRFVLYPSTNGTTAQVGYRAVLTFQNNPPTQQEQYVFNQIFGNPINVVSPTGFPNVGVWSSQFAFCIPSEYQQLQIHSNCILQNIEKSGSSDVLYQTSVYGSNFGDVLSYINPQIQQNSVRYSGAKQLNFYITDGTQQRAKFQSPQKIYLKLCFFRCNETHHEKVERLLGQLKI